MAQRIPMLDAAVLAGIPDQDLQHLAASLKRAGLNADNLGRFSGKEVTRYVNISPFEEDVLRRQVICTDEALGLLVDFFMLGHPVAEADLRRILGSAACDTLASMGMFWGEPQARIARAYIAPLQGGLFLNDGMRHTDDQGHVLTLVLEQAYIVKVARALAAAVTKAPPDVLDICCGSGVIGQAAALGDCHVAGVDINPRAVEYARFNARLNGFASADYKLHDITRKDLDRRYGLVLSNPPYNAHVPVSKGGDPINLTLHAGMFGDTVSQAVFEKLPDIMMPGGLFLMVGIFLLKDGKVALPNIDEMSRRGTVVMLHQPVSDVNTWEGMRLLFNCTPAFEKLPAGHLKQLLARERDRFNQVAWGIVAYAEQGKPGYHNIYNLPTDGMLISPATLSRLIDSLS